MYDSIIMLYYYTGNVLKHHGQLSRCVQYTYPPRSRNYFYVTYLIVSVRDGIFHLNFKPDILIRWTWNSVYTFNLDDNAWLGGVILDQTWRNTQDGGQYVHQMIGIAENNS